MKRYRSNEIKLEKCTSLTGFSDSMKVDTVPVPCIRLLDLKFVADSSACLPDKNGLCGSPIIYCPRRVQLLRTNVVAHKILMLQIVQKRRNDCSFMSGSWEAGGGGGEEDKIDEKDQSCELSAPIESCTATALTESHFIREKSRERQMINEKRSNPYRIAARRLMSGRTEVMGRHAGGVAYLSRETAIKLYTDAATETPCT